MIKRILTERIEKRLFKDKVIIVFGPRQCGKTTLVNTFFDKYRKDTVFYNGDESDTKELFSNPGIIKLKQIAGKKKLVIIDEAQLIPDIGIILKLFADHLKGIQVIATGSSAFELADKTSEPLTGRKYEFFLYSLCFSEMVKHTDIITEKRNLEHRLIYGYYPEIVTKQGEEKELLGLLSGSYLYKDIFITGQLKKPLLIEKLLTTLALQIGNEVNYHELGLIVGLDNETVEHYIDLLEKSFIVFRLSSLSRNLRNELKKSRKIYFWDNGIRNAIIKNFNPLTLRQDTGALWENFLILERIKANHYSGELVNKYFWRTHSQQEIDYIEEKDGQLSAYEFKWNPKAKGKFPKTFFDAYPNSSKAFIHKDNYESFLGFEG